MEKAKDARDSALKNLSESSSKNVINKAHQEFKAGDIGYEQYIAILNSVKKTSDNLNEKTIKENADEEFIAYLKGRGMLEGYLAEHKIVAEQEKIKNLGDGAKGLLNLLETGYKNGDLSKEDYEELRSIVIEEGTKATGKFTSEANVVNASDGNDKSYLDEMQESEMNELDGKVKKRDDAEGSGTIIWRKRNQEISKGEKVDYEELKKQGINPDLTVVNGKDVYYTKKDGDFIIFKDNPDLVYYQQGAEMGKLNHFMADKAQFLAEYYSPFAIAKFATKGAELIKPLQKVTDKYLNTTTGSIASAYGIHEVEKNVPIVNEIIGTPIPKVGSKEVILYLSDDNGETWDSKVRFEIDSDGNVKSNDFSS